MNYIKLRHITPFGNFEYFRVSKRNVQDIEDEWESSSNKDTSDIVTGKHIRIVQINKD